MRPSLDEESSADVQHCIGCSAVTESHPLALWQQTSHHPHEATLKDLLHECCVEASRRKPMETYKNRKFDSNDESMKGTRHKALYE